MTAKNGGVTEKNPPQHNQQRNRPSNNHRFATTNPIGNETKQRTTNHPAERDRGSEHNGSFIFATTRLLEKAHTPGHSQNGRWNKQQTGDETARVTAAAREAGLVLLSCGLYGNVIRILVPFTISDDDLEAGLDILEECLGV